MLRIEHRFVAIAACLLLSLAAAAAGALHAVAATGHPPQPSPTPAAASTASTAPVPVATLMVSPEPSVSATTTPAPGPASFAPFPLKKVLVLMYHQVTNTPDSVNLGAGHYGPAISPQQFESDLEYLSKRGYRAVDPLRALAYLDGRADASSLPDHPYVITFDDGFVSAWTDATPILKRHHAKAMMFIEGIRTDVTPGRLTSAQIRAMVGSGVWEIQSHGYTGHWALQIGPKASDLSPYWYANLAWLPKANRFETPTEFEERLFEDFRRSRQTLEAITGLPVSVFAYPSGEYGQNIALPPGVDPNVFGDDEGNSNATGLTPHILSALERAGFSDAFAVFVLGNVSAASPADSKYLYPRIGDSPSDTDPAIDVLADGEINLPALSPDYHWVDCSSLGVAPDGLWVAGGSAPYLYRLDPLSGRLEDTVQVPAFQNGREGQPVLAGAVLAQPDGSLVVYQQMGWWKGGQARLVHLRIVGDAAVDIQITPLTDDAGWFVGVANTGQHMLGMTEDGDFYSFDARSAQQLPFSLPKDAPGWKQDDIGRYVGLAYAHGLLYAVDRKNARLLGVDPATGSIKEALDLPKADIIAVGGDDRFLWLLDTAHEKQALIRLRSTRKADP